MAEVFEDRRIGPHIKAHRLYLGVPLRDLLLTAGIGHDRTLKFVESAEQPAISLIERHHTALMTAYSAVQSSALAPMARREQWYTTSGDTVLWHLAMDAAPSVVWWWAAKRMEGRRGAWCNVCAEMIHTYDVGRGVTARVRLRVMEHRLIHINTLTAQAAAGGIGATQ